MGLRELLRFRREPLPRCILLRSSFVFVEKWLNFRDEATNDPT